MNNLSKKLAVVVILCITMSSANAQERCGTMQHLAMQKAMDPKIQGKMSTLESEVQSWVQDHPNLKKMGQVITIPTVVHVVYATAAQNISDVQIISQIDVMNEDFRKMNADTSDIPDAFKSVAADTEIEFCLALRDPNGNPTTGITRTSTTETSFSTNDDVKFDASGGKNAWSTSDYLNIWVCNLGGGVLGYGEFPFGVSNTWGLVVEYTAFGRVGNVNSPYNLGRTTVHEICHCFNLYHIWGDDGGSCNGDDGVSDTPDQADATNGCPSYPATDACSPNNPGYMFMNYMDYSYDACTNMFTYGQKARMLAILNGNKASLKTSLGCVPPNALDASVTIVTPLDTACGTNAFYPQITLTNVGSDPLTSLTINYQIDNEPMNTYLWTGVLATLATEQVTLSPLAASVGLHSLMVFSESPNGGTDGYLLNDSAETNFTFVIGNSASLSLDLGTFQIAQFLSWDVRDSTGNVIDSVGGYEQNKSYTEGICLPNGCYTFSLYNPPDNAVGSFALLDAQGNDIGSGSTLTDTSFSFCVTLAPPIDTTSINPLGIGWDDVMIYPNPFTNHTKIEFENAMPGKHTLMLYTTTGRLVRRIEKISGGQILLERQNLVPGMYYFILKGENGNSGGGKLIIQ